MPMLGAFLLPLRHLSLDHARIDPVAARVSPLPLRKRPVKCIFKISQGVRMMGPVTDLSPETAPWPSRPAKSIGPPSWPISAAPG